MARDNAQEKRDNLNRGIPKQSGLDDGTRASLERSLNAGNEGIKVGSFRDLQVGLTDIPVADRPLNPTQDPDGVIEINEFMAQEGVDEAAGASGGTDYDDYTVEELKDELAAQGQPVSGTKQELIDRLNGK